MVWTCATTDIGPGDLIRWDHGAQGFCLYHFPEGDFFAAKSHCSREKVHLCDGLVMDHAVERPRHDGVFVHRTGEAIRAPACVNLRTWPVRVEGGDVQIEV
jgi:3-phenylpropionate/trans-cinnamate dioxygenase ferredoxin subunit